MTIPRSIHYKLNFSMIIIQLCGCPEQTEMSCPLKKNIFNMEKKECTAMHLLLQIMQWLYIENRKHDVLIYGSAFNICVINLANPLGKRCLQQGAVLPGCGERSPDFILFAVGWDAAGSSPFAVTPPAGVFLPASRGLLTGMGENKAPRVFQFLLKIPLSEGILQIM